MLDTGMAGLRRASRLTFQMPKESRFVTKVDPSLVWEWRDLYLMTMTQSLRQLVWAKTKDAARKVPKDAPQIIGPEYILKVIKEAEDKKKRLGKRNVTPNARIMNIDELDAYLKKPRKSVSK